MFTVQINIWTKKGKSEGNLTFIGQKGMRLLLPKFEERDGGWELPCHKEEVLVDDVKVSWKQKPYLQELWSYTMR